MNSTSYCKTLLQDELLKRKQKNSMYSLRALARDLEISTTSICDLLNDKRTLSKKNQEKVVEKLHLSPEQANFIKDEASQKKLESTLEDVNRLYLEEDTFNTIANWYYPAILNLAKLKKNKSCPNWIASRLGISVKEAQMAIERLQRLGLIEIKRKKLSRTAQPLSVGANIPSRALKKFHHDTLSKAQDSLYNVPIELREISSVMMAINPGKIQEASNILKKAKRKITKLLEEGQTSEVYLLAFQLFPLTQNEGEL
jgi:uncharacterized protein (TIGR02147 family)